MSKIKYVKGRQVFDSRGNPTVEAEIILENGLIGRSIVPSGASVGRYEAHELRDKNKDYLNKSVLDAVNNINSKISKSLTNQDSTNQIDIDEMLIKLDGTNNKSNLGANAILAVSIANLKASAKLANKEIYRYLKNKDNPIFSMPFPLMNIINGGAHANNSLEIQEFMIRPDGANSFKECIQMCFLVIQNLKKNLEDKNISTSVGDEGGFAPSLGSDEEAIELIIKSISLSGFKPGKDFSICLDVAANELKKPKNVEYFLDITKKYPIKSIEDPFFEDDWESWKQLTKKTNAQIVGDDLFVTNKNRLERGIKEKSANSILIKPNQIGTVSETLETIKLAQDNNFSTIISHRSGDSEDTFIADLAVATNSSQIKTGSLARSERVAKYNRLLRIEEELGKHSKMAKI
ncbi:MAG: phosphopyruvate hydratase [Candidatus Pelagibacter sp.]|nr:phosphopyruvate hydratase [Candidatus Pelagibacter sp.]|tara:strand:- start:2370 stop:3584 length:1215 start_codon:yes stop_codon:yes gene_type:complete